MPEPYAHIVWVRRNTLGIGYLFLQPSRTHTLTHSHTHSLTHTHTHTHSHTHALSLSLTHTHTLSLARSLVSQFRQSTRTRHRTALCMPSLERCTQQLETCAEAQASAPSHALCTGRWRVSRHRGCLQALQTTCCWCWDTSQRHQHCETRRSCAAPSSPPPQTRSTHNTTHTTHTGHTGHTGHVC